jgi:hypothetical protein
VTGADVALELAIVHYSGGVGGQFTTVFCLTIAAAAFVLAMPGGLAAAMLSSMCFVGYQVAEAHLWVTPPGKDVATSRTSGVIDAPCASMCSGGDAGAISRTDQAWGRALDTPRPPRAAAGRHELHPEHEQWRWSRRKRRVMTMNAAAGTSSR